MPQHLSQEVFNTQTTVVEQAEIVPQAPTFDQVPNNIFLSSSDFVENHLTLQVRCNFAVLLLFLRTLIFFSFPSIIYCT